MNVVAVCVSLSLSLSLSLSADNASTQRSARLTLLLQKPHSNMTWEARPGSLPASRRSQHPGGTTLTTFSFFPRPPAARWALFAIRARGGSSSSVVKNNNKEEKRRQLVFVYFGDPHGCGSGRGGVSAGYPTPESGDASDAEPEEGPREAEETKGVGFNPDLSVRRLACGREGVFLLGGTFRWGFSRLFSLRCGAPGRRGRVESLR